MVSPSEEQSVSFYYSAKNYPKRKGYDQPEIGEDFAAWAVIKFISGRKASLSQLFIDFLRGNFGDKRSGPGTERSKANWGVMDQRKNDSLLKVDGDHQQLMGEFLKDHRVNSLDRTCIILRYVWGLNETEIAYCLGFCRQNICRRIRDTEAYLARKIKKD